MIDLMDLTPAYILSEDELYSLREQLARSESKYERLIKELETENNRFKEENDKLLRENSALKMEAAIKLKEFKDFIEPLGLSTRAKNAIIHNFVLDSPLNPPYCNTVRLELRQVKTYDELKRIVAKDGLPYLGKATIAEIVQKCDEMIKGETNG